MKDTSKLTDEYSARLRRRVEDKLRKDPVFLAAVIIMAIKENVIKTD